MLTCRDVTERTTDYMERALSLGDSLAMRLHFGLCSSCRTYLKQLRKTVLFLRDHPLGAPPSGLAERIAEQAVVGRDSDKPADTQD